MERPKWLNLNLLITIVLLVIAFIAYDAIMAVLIWAFVGLKTLVINDNRWWTLALFVILLIVSMKVAAAQAFVDTVKDMIAGWFGKKKSNQ